MAHETRGRNDVPGGGTARPALEPPSHALSGWRRVGLHAPFAPARDESAPASQRREPRFPASVRASTTLIDPVRDPVTREPCYLTSEEDLVTSLSRRGAGLRCARPPQVGARVLLQIETEDGNTVEVIGRACWTRVEYVPGEHGARAVAAVGVELIGGSSRALDRYEGWFLRVTDEAASIDDASVAGPPATG